MRDGACVAIGWPDIGDLSGFEKDAPSKQRLVGLFGERYPGSPQQTGKAANQILNFAKGISSGDAVLACDGQAVLGVGRVTGDYFHEPGSDFPHRRPVEWLSLDEWRMPEPEGLQTTVHRLKKSPVNLVEAEKRSLGGPVVVPPPGPSPVAVKGARTPRLGRRLGTHPVRARTQGAGDPLRASGDRQDLLGRAGGARTRLLFAGGQALRRVVGRPEGRGHGRPGVPRVGPHVQLPPGVRLRGLHRGLPPRTARGPDDLRPAGRDLQAVVPGRRGPARAAVLPDHRRDQPGRHPPDLRRIADGHREGQAGQAGRSCR